MGGLLGGGGGGGGGAKGILAPPLKLLGVPGSPGPPLPTPVNKMGVPGSPGPPLPTPVNKRSITVVLENQEYLQERKEVLVLLRTII